MRKLSLKVDISGWLGLALLLLLGWSAVLPLVLTGSLNHPLFIGATGLVFSGVTAMVMMRIFRSRTEAQLASNPTPSDTVIIVYPIGFRRLLRFGLLLCPFMLALSFVGLNGGFGKQSPIFIVAGSIAGLGLILILYVLTCLVCEVRVSDEGLEARMASGRSIAIGWHEIARFRPIPHRDGFRIETKSGRGFSLENSFPGYERLLHLIEQRLQHRDPLG